MKNSDYTANENRYSTGMKYRRCGQSGIRLPEISIGFWHNFGGDDDFVNGKKILHHAFDRGITHFDLANNYGPPYGSAEENFGRIMSSSFTSYRNELFISTKAGYNMWGGPYGEWGSRKYLLSSLEDSLKRMKLDYVDIFYSHRYDPETPLEESMQALVDAVRQGKALYAGISNYPAKAAGKAYAYLSERDVPCLLHQGKYNLLHREPETEGILKQATEYGTSYIAFSPLAQGLLTGKYLDGKIPEGSRMSQDFFLKKDTLTEEMLSKLKKLNTIAEARGQSLPAMALAWVLRNDLVSSVIVGVSSVEQLNQNIEATRNTTFEDDELEMIGQIIR
ncbi:MAG: aldo/keto reductase [Bacteroidales bacterium]|nr:aldo/keto reductase [Bacteroidales bacterium]MCF8343587.1 aldo/keto reductase [Bacteroidales bacterium]MCF8351538.1 aldo/keto reductase [Bacteroidales bacterium]MCF8377716.1 aldo/keto reductase [Bacteroidales bacterium]MCF8402107.1 aldo/keto reductase [Bacteroidales bacterium]